MLNTRHVFNLIHSNKFSCLPFTHTYSSCLSTPKLSPSPPSSPINQSLAMATSAPAFCNFRPSPVVCSSQSKPNSFSQKPSSSSSSSSNWWTPLFGISADPDYIQSSGNLKKELGSEISDHFEKEITGKPRSKFSIGCFTEEKAKELRRKTIETSMFHDIMYHSAIASRLASDVTGPQER